MSDMGQLWGWILVVDMAISGVSITVVDRRCEVVGSKGGPADSGRCGRAARCSRRSPTQLRPPNPPCLTRALALS